MQGLVMSSSYCVSLASDISPNPNSSRSLTDSLNRIASLPPPSTPICRPRCICEERGLQGSSCMNICLQLACYHQIASHGLHQEHAYATTASNSIAGDATLSMLNCFTLFPLLYYLADEFLSYSLPMLSRGWSLATWIWSNLVSVRPLAT